MKKLIAIVAVMFMSMSVFAVSVTSLQDAKTCKKAQTCCKEAKKECKDAKQCCKKAKKECKDATKQCCKETKKCTQK